MSLATRSTAERAIAHYLSTVQLDGVGLADFPATFKGDEATEVPLSFHCIAGEIGAQGEIPEEWANLTMPAVVVASARSDPHYIGYDICDVSIVVITTPEEIDAPARVQARIGWVSTLFDEDNLDAVVEDLNPPLTGSDARAVKGIQFIGLERNGEDRTENGRQILESVKLRVHAMGLPESPADPTSPDTFLV